MPPADSSASKEATAGLFGYSVQVSRECCDPAWDTFLTQCPGGHHEQTSLWGQVKNTYGWRPLRIIVKKQDQILGGAQVLIRQFGRWGRIGQISRGPVAASSNPRLVEAVLRGLHNTMRDERLSYLAVVPPYDGAIFEPGLQHLGYWRKPNALPPSGTMTATLLLDLSPSLDDLMARMRATMRKNIRRASRTCMIVRQGAASDVEKFRELMWALCARRGCAPSPPQRDYFEHMWRVFRSAGHVMLLNAESEGETVASIFVVAFGDTVRTWKIGWAGDHARSHPTELLYWEAIRWAKLQGFRYFDFVSIDRDLATKLQNNESIDWSAVWGPDNFKVGFGGSPIVLPEPYYRSYHPLIQTCLRAGGRHVLESPYAAKLLSRLTSSSE